MVAPGPDEGGRAPEDHRHVTVVGIRRAVRRARGAIHPVGVVYHDHVAGMRGIETIAHTLVDAVACASVFLQLGTGVDPCDIGERAQGGDGYIFHLCPADGLSRKRRECEISSGRLRYCCNAYCCKPCSAVRVPHYALFLDGPLAVLDHRTLVVGLLALGKRNLAFDQVALPVDAGNHRRITLLLRGSEQSRELLLVEEQFAGTVGFAYDMGAGRIERYDGTAQQPGFTIL